MTINRAGQTWQQVQKWATGEIARLRDELEKDQPDETTRGLRGEIKAVRALLALGKNEPEIEVPEDDNYGRQSL